jgi:hypothetical protein
MGLQKAINKVAVFTFAKVPKSGYKAGKAVRKEWKKK